MTPENWAIAIVIISAIIQAVATLAAPILHTLVISRKTQPIAAPVPTQPKTVSQRFWGWFSWLVSSPLPQALAICYCSIILVFEMLKTTPVSRDSVLTIATMVGGIFMNFTFLTLRPQAMLTYQIADELTEHTKAVNTLTEATGLLADIVRLVVEKTHQPQSALDKIVSV